VGALSNWRADLFDEIGSVKLKGLYKSNIHFGKTINNWISVGKYLICGDEIFNIDEFIDKFEIPITELGLKPIDNLVLRNLKYNKI